MTDRTNDGDIETVTQLMTIGPRQLLLLIGIIGQPRPSWYCVIVDSPIVIDNPDPIIDDNWTQTRPWQTQWRKGPDGLVKSPARRTLNDRPNCDSPVEAQLTQTDSIVWWKLLDIIIDPTQLLLLLVIGQFSWQWQ